MMFLEVILKYLCGMIIIWELPQALGYRVELAMAYAAEWIGLLSLNEKQKQAVRAFLHAKYVFVSLPTGFGKSVCFQSIPFVFDYLKSSQSSYMELSTHLLQANSDKSYFTVSPNRSDNCSAILFLKLGQRLRKVSADLSLWCTAFLHTWQQLEWLSWFLARCHRSSYDRTVPLPE